MTRRRLAPIAVAALAPACFLLDAPAPTATPPPPLTAPPAEPGEGAPSGAISQPVLTVTSDPSGAQLAIDGVAMGLTPVRVPLAPGRHEVALMGEGYAPLRSEVEVREGESREIHLSLAPAPVAAAAPTASAPKKNGHSRPAPPAPPAPPRGETLALGVGSQKFITFDGLARVAVGDPDVVDARAVGEGLLIIGVGEGRTTLLAWTRRGERIVYTVSVRKTDSAGMPRPDEKPPPEKPPPPAADRATVERFPTVEAPDRVAPLREFSVLVSLTEEQVTPEVEVKQGETTAEGKLALTLPAAPEIEKWTLDVVLSAPGFEIAGGANTAQLVLPRFGDSTPAKFTLAAKAAGAGERKIYATLWHQGAYLAKIARAIAVAEAAPGADAGPPARAPAPAAAAAPPRAVEAVPAKPPLAAARGPETEIDLELRPPDLTLYVRAAEIIVVTPHLTPPIRSYAYAPPPGLRAFLDARYAKFSAAVPRGVKSVHTEPEPLELKEKTVPLLRGFGRELYDQFAPAAFKEVFWRLRDKLGAKFAAIQIVTDDPALPWELMRPARPGGGTGDELDFLGIEFRVARWHVSDSASQLQRPPQQMLLRELFAIAPRYEGSEALAGQSEEMVALEDIPGFRRTEGKLRAVRGLFERPPDGIVHFAGHGVVRAAGGIPDFAIRLEDTELDVTTWRGISRAAVVNHPLVFFNACEIGQAERVAGFVDGWAPAVLDAGASGYIGGLWPLGDRGAAEFARFFYRSLGEALASGTAVSVADLLRPARRRFYETGDPTALAYVYYGDPNFRVSGAAR